MDSIQIPSRTSVKVNAILNAIRLIVNMAFPVVTFPYVSRILDPEGIGQINFASSIVYYFILIASMGIPIYGVRQVARKREDHAELSKVVAELLLLNLTCVLFSCILFIGFIFIEGGTARSDLLRKLMYIYGISIVFDPLGVAWLYEGLEDFRYITIRNLCFQVIALVLIFVLIRDKNDVIVYAGISVFSSVGSNVLNILHMRKYVSFRDYVALHPLRHIIGILMSFAISISSTIYLNINMVMLGYMVGPHSTGIFAAANKLTRMVLVAITSLGTVLLPRASFYVSTGRQQQYIDLISKAIRIVVLFSFPCVVGLELLSSQVIRVIAGNAFLDSVTTLRIIAPTIIAASLSNLLSVQVLYANGREIATLYITVIIAAINIVLNLFFISSFKYNGAAVVSVVTEFLLLIILAIFTRHSGIRIHIGIKEILPIVVSTTVMGLAVKGLKYVLSSPVMNLLICVPAGIVIYTVMLFIMRDELVMEIRTRLINRILKKIG